MVHHGQTRHTIYPGTDFLPDRASLRFRFRCETSVHAWYSTRHFPYGLMIRRALLRFFRAVNGGIIDISQLSRFLRRTDLADKVESSVRLTADQKDLLEKLAFTLDSSQAEILRMALEWYMEAISPHATADVKFLARQKWHHATPSIIMNTCFFPFWRHERQLEWQIPPPEVITAAFFELRSSI